MSRSLQRYRLLSLATGVAVLPLMRFVAIPAYGTWIIPADLALTALVGTTLADPRSLSRLLRNRLMRPTGAYIACWSLSVLFGRSTAVELLQAIYLCLVAASAAATLDSERGLLRVQTIWAAVATILAGLALMAVPAWYLGGDVLLLPWLSSSGSLPPGDYPRLALTFFGPNQLASYLLVGALLAYGLSQVSGRRRWARSAAVIGAGMLPALSLASGGLATTWLAGEAWRRRSTRTWSLALGLLVLTVTVGTLSLPALARGDLEPAVRWQTWTAAVQTILEHPLVGETATEGLSVRFVAPDGSVQLLTDAHNTFLDTARRAGLPAALALVWLLATACRADNSTRGAALAVIAAWGVHGLFGSFENTRHFWLLVGIAGASAVPGDDGVAKAGGHGLDPVESLGRESDQQPGLRLE